jgi:exosortase A
MSSRTKLIGATTLLTCTFLLLYWHVIAKLVHDWSVDENYSHGFLIVPLAVYFAWERRDRLQRLPVRGSSIGLVLVVGSLLVLIAGLLGAELFLTRISMIGMLIGMVLFVLGRQHLKALAFPLAILLLMIPVPTILFNQILFPLQLLASRVGEASLSAAGIPVLREGNVITLANTKLEVAEACSGIRSLVSLLTLAIVYGYFVDSRTSIRLAITLSAIPVAILANGVRVAGTGFAAHYLGPAAAEGFFHTFSGWLVFVVAFVLLCGVMQFLRWLAPGAKPSPPLAAPVAVKS